MRRLLPLLLVCFRIFAGDGAQRPKPSPPKLVKAKPDPLLARLARFLGISLTPPPLIRADAPLPQRSDGDGLAGCCRRARRVPTAFTEAWAFMAGVRRRWFGGVRRER